MQLSFFQKEQFFHELGQLARSGISLPASLEMLSRSRRRFGHFAREVLIQLQASRSAGEAFSSAGFAASDGAVIEAGESTGHLDQVFEELEAYYKQLDDARRQIINRSAYSVGVLHLGAVLLALPAAVSSGALSTFLWGALPVLVVFYALVVAAFLTWRLICVLLAKSTAGAHAVSAIWVLGNLLTNLTAWKFSLVLSLYVRAGGGMLKAFNLAGASCGNALLEAASANAVPRVQNGERLATAFCTQPGLPELLERSIEVGEHSGRLDEETRRAAELFKKRTLTLMDNIARALPVAVYICVCVYTGYKIVMMAKGFYGSLDSIGS